MTRELCDAYDGEVFGIATAEQAAASDAAGETGAILIDGAGVVRPEDADRSVFGPLRTVYVRELMPEPIVAPPITLIEDERGIVTSCCSARVEVTRVVRDLIDYSPHRLDNHGVDNYPTLVVRYDRVDSALDSDSFRVQCAGCGHSVEIEVEEA